MNNSIDNKDCPPLMSDGRHFTDYRPNCVVHELLSTQNNITNSYDLKMLLTRNAEQLRDINRKFYSTKNSCTSCGKMKLEDPNKNDKYWDTYAHKLGYSKEGKVPL